MQNKQVQKPLLFITMWMEKFLSTLAKVQNTFRAFRLTKEEGEKLKAQIEQGSTSLTLDEINYIQTEGDHLADFSSRGPVTANDDIKPDITAPGVAILSTVPEYINDPQEGENYAVSYERMQGTSMASPHIVGVAALILQEHPDYSPFDVKSVSYEHS